jgi:signal transduction histidine kinase
VLQVRDDGIGIQRHLAAEGDARNLYSHLGLLGMAERAQAVGGQLSLSPYPLGGTVATVRVPLSSASQARL